jgi:succinyl-diaminopimelate desuccinylase
MIVDPVILSQELIGCASVTPIDNGAMDILVGALERLNFNCTKLEFDGVLNLYARYGTTGKNICFAGHTDVVPVGDLSAWDSDPFIAEIRDGMLYGRGAVDMKPAIASFIAAVSELLNESEDLNGSISLLITGDEEGLAHNGTVKVLEHLAKHNEKIDYAIVGEPTNPTKIGEMIKIGRRGSLNVKINVGGVQGHVAYPHLADNPITTLINIMHGLKARELDQGNQNFDPSNLEIIGINSPSLAYNVIPDQASCRLNIRFNDLHTPDSLLEWIKEICDKHDAKYSLDIIGRSDSFLTKDIMLRDVMAEAVREVTGITPEFSTTGGTSDARFIKNYAPVVEFGLVNATAHKVNECTSVSDIITLKAIYLTTLRKLLLS